MPTPRKTGRKVGVLGVHWVRGRQAVDDHCPQLVEDCEDGEAHPHAPGQLEVPVTHVLAVVEDRGDKEEEIPGT